MSTTTTNLGLIKPELTDNVSITDINENMDKIDVAMSENTDKIETGWIPLTGTFTYSNSTTITTSIDCTSFLSAGMKLKCTNGTVKMSVIKSVTSTTIVLESSVLASGTITDVYFSIAYTPFGVEPINYETVINTKIANLQFATVGGTMPTSVSVATTIDLPAGFTPQNTFIVCARILRNGVYIVYNDDGLMAHFLLDGTSGKIEINATDAGVSYCAGSTLSVVIARL